MGYDESQHPRDPKGQFADKPKAGAGIPNAGTAGTSIGGTPLADRMDGQAVTDVFRTLDTRCRTDEERRELRSLYADVMERNGYQDLLDAVEGDGIDLKGGDTIPHVYDPDTFEAGTYACHGRFDDFDLTLDQPAGQLDMGDAPQRLDDINWRCDDPDTVDEEIRQSTARHAIDRFVHATPTEERVRLLHDLVDRMYDERPGEVTVGGEYKMFPSATAEDSLRELGLDDDGIDEAREYGGWDPARHDYARFNDDGDLEGLSRQDADRLVWENRETILSAAGHDDELPPAMTWRMGHID